MYSSNTEYDTLNSEKLTKAIIKFPLWPPFHGMVAVNEEIIALNKILLRYVDEPQKATLADVGEQLTQSINILLRLKDTLEKCSYVR